MSSPLLSASAPGPERAKALISRQPQVRHSIAFDLADDALATVLHAWASSDPQFRETDLESADLVVTDQDQQQERADFAHRHVLRVGADRPGINALDTLDPILVTAAARLLSRNYTLEPRTPASSTSAYDRPALSERETQVALLLVEGASNKTIARALGISVHTVKFHVASVLEKLHAANRADAVASLIRQGVVSI